MWHADFAMSAYKCALVLCCRLLTLGREGAGGALVCGWAQAVAGAAGGIGCAGAAIKTGWQAGGVA